ncbi:MAG: flagellar motor protein MotA [Proteobacteria bacterium]|nr:flagellar motor protein MotA [Pseudomonadota bacterium]
MTRPQAARMTMTIFSVAMLLLCILVHNGIYQAFSSNPIFNTGILVTLLLGMVAAYRQIGRIDSSVKWIHGFKGSQGAPSEPPFLLVPIASVLQKNDSMPYIGATSLRAMLDGVFTRVDESRDLSRYLMNVLILLGLLGTFWGLLQTVGGIGSVIGSLSLGEGDLKLVFDRFKDGLQKPLVGMGISFSASLFGLASSLVLGFLDLQTGRAQNVFCCELEEWLGRRSAISESTFSHTAPPASYQEAIVVTLTEQLERLQRTMRQQFDLQSVEQGNIRALSETVFALSDNLKSHNVLLAKLTQLQNETTPALLQLTDVVQRSNAAHVEEHVRNVDLSLRDIALQLAQSSSNHTSELRDELRIIARLLASDTTKDSSTQVN